MNNRLDTLQETYIKSVKKKKKRGRLFIKRFRYIFPKKGANFPTEGL